MEEPISRQQDPAIPSHKSNPVLGNGLSSVESQNINGTHHCDHQQPSGVDWGSNGDAVHEEDDNLTRVLLSCVGSNKEYVAYKERWYILVVFSLMALMQSTSWNTWGPIENTARAVLGWEKSQFALLANWGAITFLISGFFFSWVLHAKGFRVGVLLAAGSIVLGLGIRCLPVPVHSMIWTANIGHIFIGLGGPVLMAGVTTLSAQWFPSNERTTATAVSATMAYMGVAASFLIGPQIVGDITHTGTSTLSPKLDQGNLTEDNLETYDPVELEEHLQEIKILLFVELVWMLMLYVAAVIYFPSAPPTPPTASAVAAREDVRPGLIAIIKKKQFWIPAVAFSLSTGSYNSWNTQIVTIFNNNVSQDTSGWIGFYCNMVGVVGGIAFGRCVDYLGGKMKLILLLLICGSTGSFCWTVLLSNNYIPFSTGSLYASVILFGFCINSTVPIFFEITVEGAFPVGEETTTLLMTWVTNVWAMLFLVFPMIGSLTTNYLWLNWVMLGSVAICIPLMFFYKEHYNRLNFDVIHPTEGELEFRNSTEQS